MLTFLSTSAPQLEGLLQDGFGFIYGCDTPGQPTDPEKYKLQKLNEGGFNQLWAGRMTPSSRNVLPATIAALVQSNSVVIRAPLQRTESRTRQDVIGEIDNVIHAALYGYGPLVAGITWVRTWHKDDFEEGLVEARYRLITFMQRANMSVYARIKQVEKMGVPPPKHIFSTKQGIDRYLDALLRCIHSYSVDRFVYMDATLSNFVDFCDDDNSTPLPRIRVIDIAMDVFRRVLPEEPPPPSKGPSKVPTSSRAWQLLWLHNTLYATCFLKRQLSGLSGLGGASVARAPGTGAGSGQHAFDAHWWGKIKGAVAETRRLLDSKSADDAELERCREFLLQAQRPKEVRVQDLWNFPHVDKPPFEGTSSSALAKSALAYFYYYFVHQPFKDIKSAYLLPAIRAAEMRSRTDVHPDARAEAEEQRRKGAEWFDAVARRVLIPAMLFFHSRIASSNGPNGGSALLVDIMAEYAITSQESLEERFLQGRVATSRQHTPNDLHNMLHTLMLVG
jgi:hypothetical protein